MRCSSNDPFRLRSDLSLRRAVYFYQRRAARRANILPPSLYRYTAVVMQHCYNALFAPRISIGQLVVINNRVGATCRFSTLLCPFIGPSDKQDNKDRYVRMVRIGFMHLSRSRLEKRTFFRVSRFSRTFVRDS